MKIINKFSKLIYKYLIRLYKIIFFAATYLPVNKKLIMFESYLGKQYSCNPRAIYEYLREHGYDYEMYWSVHKQYIHIFEKNNVPYIKRFSLKWLFYMARARYWINNSRLPLWIPKPKHTIYIQTWHGTPLKKLALDMGEVHMPNTNTEKYKANFIKTTSKWDYLISPNAYSTEIFRRAFQFKKEILEYGYPRNDYLYLNNNAEKIKEIKLRLNVPLEKKVILYAPTWRDNQYYQVGQYKFNLNLDLNKMMQQLSDQYVLLIRMHYLIVDQLNLKDYQSFAYDVSYIEDIRELYLISDLLITDYSSVFFDYANLKRPILFYVYDIEEYRDVLRGFYINFEEEAPGPLVYSTDEIIQEIKNLENNGYKLPQLFKSFYNQYCYLEDGNATKRIVERLFSN